MIYKIRIVVAILTIGINFNCEEQAVISRVYPNCVNIREFITSQDTGFYVFTSGLQERGFAKATKINQAWEASVEASIRNRDNRLFLLFYTYIIDGGGSYRRVENIIFTIDLSTNQNNTCFRLVNDINEQAVKLAKGSYASMDEDVGLDDYYVDETGTENFLEIESIDLENAKIKGRFMVTFLRRSETTPFTFNLPVVRFFNGYFEADIVFFGNEVDLEFNN